MGALAILLLAVAVAGQTPTNVRVGRTGDNSSVEITWTAPANSAGVDSYVVRATPHDFYDSMDGALAGGWQWNAPCNPTNAADGLCIYSLTVFPGQLSIGITGGVSSGYTSGRGNAPHMLRPEVFDSRADFCASVYADNKLANLGYVPNVQGGILVTDASNGMPIMTRWITTWVSK